MSKVDTSDPARQPTPPHTRPSAGDFRVPHRGDGTRDSGGASLHGPEN